LRKGSNSTETQVLEDVVDLVPEHYLEEFVAKYSHTEEKNARHPQKTWKKCPQGHEAALNDCCPSAGARGAESRCARRAATAYSVETGPRQQGLGRHLQRNDWFACCSRFSCPRPPSELPGPGQLHTLAGMFNTVLMISGSYFVAKAVLAIRRNQRALCTRWLVGLGFTIAGYLMTKYFELQWNVEHGIVGTTGIFYTVYYYLTFTHAVHIVWGAMGLVWVLFRTHTGAYTPENHEGLEAYALYWHATDLAWLIIFPLVYVLR
jgi:cytochrome c oxidase subunit 3